ncbi:MAG: argininosuccinate synthase [Spirochaetaceae bacterium]|jgi:argininosuccinate synthase|nr:argininosuccinate synthase [Spirochaetaceae bacterium]
MAKKKVVEKGSAKKMKIVLAYSGGLDTTVLIPWLKENTPKLYGAEAEIIAVAVDVGQACDWKAVKARAKATGAAMVEVVNVQKEYVEDYLWPYIKSGAVYEDKYLLGTSTARPLIAKILVDVAKREKADAIAHGATGKGNDQIRFELGIMALGPEFKIIAPWRIWKIKSREEEIRYLKKRGIEVPVKRRETYSRDDNIWHISHEGQELEETANEAKLKQMLQMTIPPEKAPNKAEYVEIGFEQGIPVSLNGKKMDGVALIKALNEIGGRNGVGIIDLLENRVVGMKSRGVYETPGGTILMYAHGELEHLCLDRQTYAFKQHIALKMAEVIYGGLWFTPLREALQAFIDSTQTTMTGTVRLKLYKGGIFSAGATSPYSLYNEGIASFATGDLYNHMDAQGFIRLYGLPVLVRSMMQANVAKSGKKK